MVDAVAAVLARWNAAHRSRYRLARAPARALDAILRCKTDALGSHYYECPEGHRFGPLANSCRKRVCPRCGVSLRADWVDHQLDRLLDVDHHHIIFTLPGTLHDIWRFNRARLGALLFLAATSTVRLLLADPRYLGAVPGILAVLHTWGDTLVLHPHVHLVVTAGGLGSDGMWLTPKRDDLLPYGPLKALFKAVFLRKLKSLFKRGRLCLPTGTTREQFQQRLDRLYDTKGRWNVHIRPAYQDLAPVIRYLSRAVAGGPIDDDRIVDIDSDHVTFLYADYRAAHDDDSTPPRKQMRLHLNDFALRWLEHVPPRGFKMARGYCLYANPCTDALDYTRHLLAQRPVTRTARSDQAIDLARARSSSAHEWLEAGTPFCPVCGWRTVRVTIPRPPIRASPPPPTPRADAA